MTSWDEEFHPSAGARNVLHWALENAASTLGEAGKMGSRIMRLRSGSAAAVG